VSVLEVRELVVDFRQRGEGRLRAVDNCSFSLEQGKTLALVGESGSGKSTVVRAVGQLIRPTSGEVLLDGRQAGRRGRTLRAYRKRVQLIFQDPFASLNPMHTVRHHLARPILMLHPGHSRARLDSEVLSLLRSVNLTPPEQIASSRPHELSGGQRQRVAIARALASDPDVLLADEPVSMLDVSIRLEILNLLDQLKRERNLALLYVTHDLATARHFSSEIMVMYRGEVVEHGPSDEVILSPSHPYTQLLAAAAPDPGASRQQLAAARQARQRSRPGERGRAGQPVAVRETATSTVAEQREVLLNEGCRFRLRCPHEMDICSSRPPYVSVSPSHYALCWLHDDQAAQAGRIAAKQ
jgi:peptide/nickel transport system ATP-binding protein